MKKATIHSFCYLVAALAFILVNGCNKNAVNLPKFPEFYGSISIPQAADSAVNFNLVMGQGDTTFQFYALAVGDQSKGHVKDIKVTIAAMPQLVDSFNTQNGTNYSVMPEGSYELDSGNAVIKAQQSQSNNVTLKLSAKNITTENSFLLPVGISGIDNPDFVINSMSKIIFFVIKVAKPQLGTMILHLDNIGDNPFECFNFNNNLITVSFSPGDGIMRKYVYEPSQDKFGDAVAISSAFSFGGASSFISISSKYMMNALAKDYLMGLDGSNLNNNTVSYTNGANAISSGFAVFDLLVGFKGSVFARGGTNAAGYASPGTFNRYSVDTSSTNPTITGQPNLGSGWDIYSQIIPYTNGLLCMTPDGNLYYYPVSDAFEVSSRTKVGSGWNKYKKIVSFGNDLLGIDSTNDIYRFTFDINKQWDL